MNKTQIDQIEMPDHEDGSKLTVTVFNVDEMGNKSLPGVQMMYLGYFVNYEPLICAKLAYHARKAGETTHLMKDSSWMPDGGQQYVKASLVLSTPPKARVEVKTRSAKNPIVKEYPLPFSLDE